MKIIEGIGAPTRKTEAALWDTYRDETTGKLYKCTFAYRESLNDSFDCQWKEIDGFDSVEEVKTEAVTKSEPVKEESKKPEPVEQKDKNKPQKGKRTNYTQYSKNAK